MILSLLRVFPDDTKIDFWGHRYFAYALTCIVILGSIFLLATRGLNFGIDFTGGTVMEIAVPVEQPDLGALREELNALGLGDVSIQEFGGPSDLLVRFPEQPEEDEAREARLQCQANEADVSRCPNSPQQIAINQVRDGFEARYAEQGEVDFRRVEFVGPQVGKELRMAGILAVLFALGAMLSYIWYRFEWQYAVGSIVALTHDMIGVLGLFSLTQMSFDLSTLAAILLVAGYSINDTVIVYDRIRENLRRFKRMPLTDLINLSVNQTLARTLMTSGTTLLALFSLWLFGGEVIRAFVNALFFGIAIGTHSSIFVASPLLVYTKLRRSAADEAAEPEPEGEDAGKAAS